MTRPALRRIAACLATGLSAAVLVPTALPAGIPGAATAAQATPAAHAALVAGEEPLRVTIDTLAPSTVPASGQVTVTGRITNVSDTPWTGLSVYMLTSATPLRTAADLDTAGRTDPATEVGNRLTDTGLYQTVSDLNPGESTDYRLSVARRDLGISGEPGVYWLGVHVLGTDAAGRDTVADGRARTFLPLMDDNGPRTTMSLLMPIKASVRRSTDGSLLNLTGWQRTLGPDGRLGRLLSLSGTAQPTGNAPTWLLDPAVADAARTVAADNAPIDFAAENGDGGGDGPSGSSSPSGLPSQSPADGESGSPPVDQTEGAAVASGWLDELIRQAATTTVLDVPYGDLDVAAAVRGPFDDLVTRAAELSATTMEGLGVSAEPVAAPAGGYLPRRALRALPDADTVILSDRAARGEKRTVLSGNGAPTVVLADSSVGDGGPNPSDRYSALAMRQRILSEAAVHALSAQRGQPLVVSTPQLWDPGRDWRGADFFTGLDVAWLDTVDLPSAVAGAEAGGSPYDAVTYPAAQRRAELPLENLLASKELDELGATFANLLTRNDTIDDDLAKQGMLGSSVMARKRPHAAAVRTRDASKQVRYLMEKVTIDGPSFVTLSSAEGPISITVINDLDATVTVGIRAETGSPDLTIRPPDPVTIGPHQRASVQLRATSQQIGVHAVTLSPTNENGQPLGSTTQFNVRSSKVGLVIWVIMGVGGAVLLAAIVLRIVRRVRARSAVRKGEA